uniref:Uncharacterized protein n=1 Tax=Oryza rufipogon TaxID=4529 RepID=A0A0E0R7P8_ORYRU
MSGVRPTYRRPTTLIFVAGSQPNTQLAAGRFRRPWLPASVAAGRRRRPFCPTSIHLTRILRTAWLRRRRLLLYRRQQRQKPYPHSPRCLTARSQPVSPSSSSSSPSRLRLGVNGGGGRSSACAARGVSCACCAAVSSALRFPFVFAWSLSPINCSLALLHGGGYVKSLSTFEVTVSQHFGKPESQTVSRWITWDIGLPT